MGAAPPLLFAVLPPLLMSCAAGQKHHTHSWDGLERIVCGMGTSVPCAPPNLACARLKA